MPAYRFCRTDDIPFLVDALNACYHVHYPDQSPMSLSDFKREIRELNIWSSSCMAAWEDRKAIAVVTGAKREHETLIHRIGVHPDFQRRGHALHLLESLSHKLSVLGPPRIVAEVPDDQEEVCDLFVAAGYETAGTFADFALATPPPISDPEEKLVAIDFDDLLRDGLWNPGLSRSWERDFETLQNRKDQLVGVAVASATRVEGFALFHDVKDLGLREIVALGGDPVEHDRSARALLAPAIKFASRAASLRVTIPKVSPEEVSYSELESMGFQKMRSYTRYTELPGSRMH
jgi:GNAT superfamily N-acetyltransferase